MIISIDEYMRKHEIKAESTVYGNEPIEIREQPIVIGDFLSFENRGEEYEEFPVVKLMNDLLESYRAEDMLLQSMKEYLEIIAEVIILIKECESHEMDKQLKDARKFKKYINEVYKKHDEEVEKKFREHDTERKEKISKNIIWYKKTAYLTTVKNLASTIECFTAIALKELSEIPIFAAKLKTLKKAIEEKEPIGVEGGPCLLGNDEMIVEVIHKGGEHYYFDFAGPRYYEGEQPQNHSLEEHIQDYGREVEDICFHNKKETITRGDYLAMLYVLEFARVLKAKAVIPLVDMSYGKYIDKVCEGLCDDRLRQKVSRDFRRIMHQISDIFLEWISWIAKGYPEVELEVLHERNKDFMEVYYRKRKEHLTNKRKVEGITSDIFKKESVIDYVTMPALPYYRWGIKNILQVDCINETDAYNRCKKLHTAHVNLSGIFYTEQISKNGTQSDYSAKFDEKNYIWKV